MRDNRRDSIYLFGALCPDRDVGAAIIMPAANSEAMREHLAEIATQVDPAVHAMLRRGRIDPRNKLWPFSNVTVAVRGVLSRTAIDI